MNNKTPRKPNQYELEQLIDFDLRRIYGRFRKREYRQGIEERVASHWIAVFDDYRTGTPYHQYKGKAMMVISDYTPGWYELYVWVNGELKLVMPDVAGYELEGDLDTYEEQKEIPNSY